MIGQNGQERGRLRCIPASLIDVYGKRIGAYAAFVYGALACKADENGEAAITTSYLSEMLGISERQVFRALDILKSHGLIMNHRERNWNVYSLTLPNSHSTLPNSHSTLPNSHSTLPNSHSTLPNSHGLPAGKGSEICSLVPPVPDPHAFVDPKILLDPKENITPLPPSGGPCVRESKKRHKTHMPASLAEQEALKASIVHKDSWHLWLLKRALTHLDIDTQWDNFVIASMARNYSYYDWYAAFQNWLISPYQQTPRRSTTGMTYTLEETNRILDEEEAWRRTL